MSVCHKYSCQERVGRSRFERKVPRYTPITQTKAFFTITSGSKDNITFSKNLNPEFTKVDSIHIFGKETATEAYTKGTALVRWTI